jgi:hypothetical protein
VRFQSAALVGFAAFHGMIEQAIDLVGQSGDGIGGRHHLLRPDIIFHLAGHDQGLFSSSFLFRHFLISYKKTNETLKAMPYMAWILSRNNHGINIKSTNSGVFAHFTLILLTNFVILAPNWLFPLLKGVITIKPSMKSPEGQVYKPFPAGI